MAHGLEHGVVRALGGFLVLLGVLALVAVAVVPGFPGLGLAPAFLGIGVLLYLFGTYGGKPVRRD